MNKENIITQIKKNSNEVYRISEFYMDAKAGEVHTEDGVPKKEPIKKFSLYGEEI